MLTEATQEELKDYFPTMNKHRSQTLSAGLHPFYFLNSERLLPSFIYSLDLRITNKVFCSVSDQFNVTLY